MHAALALRDGSVWKGTGFGAPGRLAGEVVFNTGMVGYTQSITDCSYKGQILCQTYPLIGNYGVIREEFESGSPKIQGYAVSEACARPSHHSCMLGLHKWLLKSGVPGIQGIDTRELTKTLRVEGTMMGVLQVSSDEIDTAALLDEANRAEDPNERDLVSEVTIKEPVRHVPAGPGKDVGKKREKIVVMDCGTKMGIVNSLLSRGAEVVRVPAGYAADRIMDLRPSGIVITNGPGDPKKVPYVVDSARKLMEHGLPVMGICMGNQILGLAMGCDTYKMKFGHRGQNHPVMDKATGKCYITSQNHGYAIDPGSVDGKEARVSFVNVNDGTVEGIEHARLPVFGVQFHPEARPGPVDTNYIFDRFMKMLGDGHA